MSQGSSRDTVLAGVAALSFLQKGGTCCACLLALLTALNVSCLPLVASGQQYKSLPVNAPLRVDAFKVQGYVGNPTTNPADKQQYEAFFTEYFFPAMTRFGPDDLADLGGMRQDLFTRYLWRSPSEQLQRELTEKAYGSMSAILREYPAYHPAVQYNAILVLGMLDDQYAIDVGPNQRPPKPLAKANKLLVAVTKAAVEGKPVPPPLLVGALIGLERHAKYHASLPPDDVAAMTAAAEMVLDMEQPLPNVDRDVAAWIKLKTAAVLANLGAVGEGNKVALEFIGLVSDQNMSLGDRCRAAALLSKLNYDGVTLDAKATVEPLVQLALEVADTEAKRAKVSQDLMTGVISTRMNRMASRSTYGMEEEKYERRPLLAKLMELREGLTAVKTAVPADQQQRIDPVLAEMRAVELSATDKDTVDLRLVVEVQDLPAKLRAVSPAGDAGAGEVPAEAFQ